MIPRSRTFPRFFRMLSFVGGLLLLTLFISQPSLCQSSASPSSTPSKSSTSSPTDKPAPPKPKHVITNEDLEQKPAPTSAQNGRVITSDNSPLLNCDTPCERTAREESGYGPDQEAEWQMQIIQARRDLVADQPWRGLLWQAVQHLDSYCTFENMASKQLSPSGNDYRSQVARAKTSEYLQNMDRTLRQGIESDFNRMQSRIQEVSALSRVRAALMRAQAVRIMERPCEVPSR